MREAISGLLVKVKALQRNAVYSNFYAHVNLIIVEANLMLP